jgi:hypothetical protein
VDVLGLASNNENVSDTSLTLTTGAAVASGATILLAIQAGDVTLSTVADDGPGLTWTQVNTVVNGVGVRIWLYRAYAASGMASGTVITATFATASTAKSGIASSFTGITNTSPEDVKATDTGTNATSYFGAGVTTTNADDLIFGVAETDGAGSPTHVATGIYTEANEVTVSGAQISLATVYAIVSSTGLKTPVGTWSTTQSPASQAYLTAALIAAADGAVPNLRTVRSNLRW